MKIFRYICIMLLVALTAIAAHYAWVYKASLSTGVFFMCMGLTLYVISDGDTKSKRKSK